MSVLNLSGKRALVVGVTNNRSLGYHALKSLVDAGAKVVCATHPDLVEKAQKALAKLETPGGVVYGVDVTSEESIQALVDATTQDEGFDYLVHAVAGGPSKEGLSGSYLDASHEEYLRTQTISADSLRMLCKYLHPHIRDNGSIIAYSFAAAHYHSVNYNIMAPAKAALESSAVYLAFDENLGKRGIRTNIISAGPIRTLSSAGVSGFTDSLNVGEMRTPMQKNVSGEDVGQATAMLLAMPGVTGQVINVDNGIICCGMGSTVEEMASHRLVKELQKADISIEDIKAFKAVQK